MTDWQIIDCKRVKDVIDKQTLAQQYHTLTLAHDPASLVPRLLPCRGARYEARPSCLPIVFVIL